MTAIRLASAAVISFLAPVQARTPEWPQFRGPGGSGVSADSELPDSIGPEENMLWKAGVPFGASSPVLTKKAVVVTGATEDRTAKHDGATIGPTLAGATGSRARPGRPHW